MLDPDLARKNVIWGLAFLGLALALLAGAVAVALIYLELD